jgi:protein SCO1/2
VSMAGHALPRRQVPLIGLLALLLFSVAVVLLYAQGPGPFGARSAAPTFRGGELAPPTTLPPLALQRADGRPFATADLLGRTSLFYFGYTRCPDVCPLTLAQINQARKQLGSAGAEVDAYFVTVDPARDTPARLREYTANFDTTVGLTGTPEQLAAAFAAFGVVAQRRDAERPGDYFMDHTALTFLVDPSGKLRLVYPYPAEPDDMAADVRALAAARMIRVSDPWARPANRSASGPAVSAVYLTVENTGRQSDKLLGAESDAAEEVEIHRTTVQSGVMRMAPAGEVELPAGGKLGFAPGGLHVMLTGLRRDLPAGSDVVLRLRFERAGEVVVRATARSQ